MDDITIEVWVAGVDGETNTTLRTPDANVAMKFLKQYDHEGSSIGLRLQAWNESTYQVLALLAERK